MCQQGQIYSTYWLSTIEALKQSITYNSEVYKRIDQELAGKIMALIPNFNIANPEHAKLLADSRNHPLNQQSFTQAYQQQSLELSFYALGGESLLARGRNHAAQVALTEGYDKIFFIDCDEGFTWQDFLTMVQAPYPVAAGVVPLKAYTTPGSFETSLNFLPFEEDELFFDDSLRTLKSTLRMARAKKTPWLKMAFTGTGFMCIDVSVFAKLAETADEYIYPNPRTGQSEVHWSFFDGGPMDERYLSEDWKLCDQIRNKLGIDIMVNVNVRATHTGPHMFVAG